MKHNHLAIWILVLALQVYSLLWYSAPMFGGQWARLQGKETVVNVSTDPFPYIVNILATVILAYITSVLINKFSLFNVAKSALVGFLISIGFVLPTLFSRYAFMQLNFLIALIDAGVVSSVVVISFVVLSLFRSKETTVKADSIEESLPEEPADEVTVVEDL